MKRNVNGRVSRRVTRGSVTSAFHRSASSGLLLAGAASSVPASRPCVGELLGERDDVLLLDPPPEPVRQRGGELVDAALAVDAVEQPVQQRAELHHLPVGAAHERRAGLVARAVDVPEQLDALRAGEVRRLRAARRAADRRRGGRFFDDRHPCRTLRPPLALGDVGVLVGGRLGRARRASA